MASSERTIDGETVETTGADGGSSPANDGMSIANAGASGTVLLGLLIVAFLALGGRLVYIHVHDGARLTAYAAHQQRSTIPLPGRRGMIVDARGRIMAGTRLRTAVYADPKIINDKAEAARRVAEILGRPAGDLETDLLGAGDRRFFVLARDVTDDQAEALHKADLYGIGTFEEPYRVYPMHQVGAAVVGFAAADGHGVAGAEHQLEPWLAAKLGFKTVVRDARRRAFWLSGNGYQPPHDGLTAVLTIDSVIQERAEQLLAETVEKYQAESAVAVVMRPGTGEVLAMANVPGFDPQEYPDYAPSRYRNRVLTDPTEPGSIFKPFVAAGALTDNLVRLEEVFDCHRGLLVDGARVLRDHNPYGLLSVQDIMVKSSNIGMALIGKRMGNQRIFKFVSAFGFGRKTGIDLQGEDEGILLPLHRWTSFSTTSLPMGQEIAVTPIQIARAFSALANGGRLVRPRVVRAIMEGEDRIVRDFADDTPAPRVISEAIAAKIKDQMLVDVVLRGTGVNAALTDYQVFGKTGTAQIAKHGGGGYEPKAYVSSFVGGAPACAPQLVVLVSVMRPKASIAYYGGTVAAPAAGELLGFSLAYLGVPPDNVATVASRDE